MKNIYFCWLWITIRFVFVAGTQCYGADTLRLMHYNLMQYCDPYGSCNTQNNRLGQKDSALRTILAYVQPDILTVNEIGKQEYYSDRILDSCFNVNGVDYWKRGILTQTSGGSSNSLANMIFYNSRKLSMYSHFYVPNSVRDFNVYRLFAHTDGFVGTDTAFLVIIVAHLKAGDAAEDREKQINTLLHQLDLIGLADNYILCGDFNIYTSEESAYQLLINNDNPAIRFYDPINRPGKWNENASFADIHTQSTHTSGSCFATGGMDDRFDFMLVSEKVLNGLDKVHALPETYHAVGQDGNRFNKTIHVPQNAIVPESVANALYNMSDHLPISMLLTVERSSTIQSYVEDFQVFIPPLLNHQLNIFISSTQPHIYTIRLISILGNIVWEKRMQLSDYISYSLDISPLTQGVYSVLVCDENENKVIKKVVKINDH